jgi:hypothetical protein
VTPYGHGRAGASAIVSSTLARHDAVHLLTRVRDLELTGPESASATVYVAMAGRPIPEPGAVASTSAALYRFGLTFAKLVASVGSWWPLSSGDSCQLVVITAGRSARRNFPAR